MKKQTELVQIWLNDILGHADYKISPLRGDASFRQFYRVAMQHDSFILMVSPINKEPIDAFIAIANSWSQQGIPVPVIKAYNQSQGFVLMTDFGDRLLQYELDADTVDEYYRAAMDLLPLIQQARQTQDYAYPVFNQAHILLELSYFKDWLLDKFLSLSLDNTSQKMLDRLFLDLVNSCLEQPQVIIHLDYHSRNLMIVNELELGIVDFQDAKQGPITYDLVSLLKDCYIAWPKEKISQWLEEYYQRYIISSGYQFSNQQFHVWFDKVGLQRHLKVLGVFSRLHLRDGKSQYLADIPRIMNYVLQVSSDYPETIDFAEWLSTTVVPKLEKELSFHRSRQDMDIPNLQQAGGRL